METLSTGAEAVCQDSGETNPTALANAWTTLKTAFTNIAEDDTVKAEAQGILHDANPNADTKVGHFAKLYDYIVKKYGSANKEDFVNRFNGVVVPPNSNSFIPTMIEANTGLVIIISIATVSILTTGLFFVLKKKKNY